jgi:hypothetical protein
MSSSLSVAAILASLEAQLARHREQAEVHAREEAQHRDQRERHEREAEEVSRRIEAFRTSAGEAVERVARAGAPENADLDPGKRQILTRLVTRMVADKAGGEQFGAAALAEEVNRRFSDLLRKPAKTRHVAMVLRRLEEQGRIHRFRRGRPHHEALYVRERPAAT